MYFISDVKAIFPDKVLGVNPSAGEVVSLHLRFHVE